MVKVTVKAPTEASQSQTHPAAKANQPIPTVLKIVVISQAVVIVVLLVVFVYLSLTR